MGVRRNWIIPVVAGLLIGSLTIGAADRVKANELRTFNDAVAKAFTHYRSALFYFRRKNVDPGAFELELFKASWIAIEKKWRDRAPDAFSGDPRWKSTFGGIKNVVEVGFAVLDKEGPRAARKAIRPIRDLLSGLRQRNQIYTYADCIDELNAQMKKVWPYRHNLPKFENLDETNKVKMEASVYEYLLLKCRNQAPEKYRNSDEFNGIFDAALNSVRTLWDATDKKQQRRFINILRELRPYDRLIFLRFG
ncbi:MAG: hypothetical protein ACJ0HN_04315 [Alphaproteobacteria bacterium]